MPGYFVNIFNPWFVEFVDTDPVNAELIILPEYMSYVPVKLNSLLSEQSFL
jgi:hypothetical protein